METNIAQQNMLPLEVQQAAAAQRLGTFIKVYKSSLTRTIIGVVFFLVGGILFLAGGIFPTDISIVTRVILLFFGISFAALAIYMAFTVIRVAGQQIYLFQQGMVIFKKNQVQAIHWNQISEVLQSITRNYRNGVYVGTTYIFTLRLADGYQIKLDNLTKNIAELGPAVAQGITRELVPRAFQTLQTGQTLTFAPFSVNYQGISKGREFIPWGQVEAINVNRGYVKIKTVGTSKSWSSVMVSKIPNYLVFTVVAEELRRQASR